ncbi:hypothetical protein [Sphaerimonospora thailandensis]|uniref:Uncharacterized protein n=1 Tax=Sphaerimonospora thailandensis TaxID=795644 RepID=A0A8J3RBH4_9ACTN|nr:hypothetical protein [Sphaerimonospora thailandensis]GIH69478.1 hypothetical protein Mth01_17310 [Sphaerimonospora thailandensis]
MIDKQATPAFQVAGRLNLTGQAEFLGIRHKVTGKPVATLAVCGIELDFTDPHMADQFAQAARVMAEQLHIAHERTTRRPTGDPA